MTKITIAAVAATMIATPALADRIVSKTAVYDDVKVYEDVQICEKGDDKTTEGAIVGGLIGSQDGNAGLGAVIGAIIGNEIGKEKCRTERRVKRIEQVFSHYKVVVEIDGVHYTIHTN